MAESAAGLGASARHSPAPRSAGKTARVPPVSLPALKHIPKRSPGVWAELRNSNRGRTREPLGRSSVPSRRISWRGLMGPPCRGGAITSQTSCARRLGQAPRNRPMCRSPEERRSPPPMTCNILHPCRRGLRPCLNLGESKRASSSRDAVPLPGQATCNVLRVVGSAVERKLSAGTSWADEGPHLAGGIRTDGQNPLAQRVQQVMT